MSSTFLQLVNRVRRKLKWEDVSSFASGDDLTTVLKDLVNEAKRDVLENHEWDFDIRSDGILKTKAATTYTNQATFTNASSTVTIVGGTDYSSYDDADVRLRIRATEDTTYGNTAFIVTESTTSGGNDVYTLETTFPGTSSGAGAGTAEFLISEYVLPTTVRDVLSVMVEDNDTTVEFVDKIETLDRVVPNAFDETSEVPEVCFVGGYTSPTMTAGTTTVPGLGIWIYPVPASVYVVRYTYRYRHPTLSTITDKLYVDDHVSDIIVDLACAKAHRSRIAPDLEAAQQIEIVTNAKLQRSAKRTGSQPLESFALRSHDRRSGGIPMGGRPSNPRVFYTP